MQTKAITAAAALDATTIAALTTAAESIVPTLPPPPPLQASTGFSTAATRNLIHSQAIRALANLNADIERSEHNPHPPVYADEVYPAQLIY